jgi:molybdate/tungstate transport system substrate-binding protein
MKPNNMTKTTEVSGKLTVMHAGSLTGMCRAVHEEFKRLNPETEIVDVSGGGVMLVRELNKGKQADVYLSVDYADIPKLMIPEFADWFVIFASTGFVLRYTDQSKYAGEVNATNWLEIIQREDVPFWRSDPENDPAGYRSLMVFQLAEKYYNIPGLANKLAEKSGKQFLYSNTVMERDKGYSFSYSSWTMGGKIIPLPDEINLSNEKFSDYYQQASVTIPGLKPGTAVTMYGEPIRLGLTIPKTCINRPAALAWTQLLLSNKGKGLMEKADKRPLKPVFGGDLSKVPAELKEQTGRDACPT